MKLNIIGCCLVSLLLATSVRAQDRVRLFLGAPSENVFAQVGGSYDDTYDDIRKQYRENAAFQAGVELVDRADGADIALMITYRGRVGLLRRTNQVNARLFALGTEYSVDLDGLEGIDWGSFSNQAKSLLRQTVDWAAANKSRLPRFASSGAGVAAPNLLAGPTTGGLFLPAPADQTPGLELRIQEIRRRRDAHGTHIEYGFKTSGFPSDRRYTVTFENVTSEDMIVSNVAADRTGALREGRLGSEKMDLARAYVSIERYARGEAFTVRVVSTDGQVSASATTFPFPIHAASGGCLLWAEVADPDYRRYDVRGRGFRPGAEVVLTAAHDREPSSVQRVTAAADGSFVHAFAHDGDGDAKLEVAGPACQLTISYGFGERGRVVQ